MSSPYGPGTDPASARFTPGAVTAGEGAVAREGPTAEGIRALAREMLPPNAEIVVDPAHGWAVSVQWGEDSGSCVIPGGASWARVEAALANLKASVWSWKVWRANRRG